MRPVRQFTFDERVRLMALDAILDAIDRASYIGGWARPARLQRLRRMPTARLVAVALRYVTMVETSPRHICPDCDGRGVVTHPLDAFGGCDMVCPTCDDGGSKGRGWIGPVEPHVTSERGACQWLDGQPIMQTTQTPVLAPNAWGSRID